MTSKIVEGVLAINKPSSISSAQVLRDLQHHFNPSTLFAPWIAAEKAKRDAENRTQKRRRRDKQSPQVKIGHGGTLDPLATGVLIAGIGKGTKHLQSFLECTKSYEAIVLFGAATDSYDRVGKLLVTAPYAHITRTIVEEALGKFRGKIMQRPPLFSALRVDGKRLYEYAREGKEVPVKIQERPVEVLELEIVEWMEGGSHPHRWPSEQAPMEERVVAQKVFHFGTSDNGRSATTVEGGFVDKDESNCGDPSGSPSSKRKRDSLNQDELISDSASPLGKRPKADPSTTMSGALPAEDSKPIFAPSTPPSTEPSSEMTASVLPTSPPQQPTPPAAKLRMTVTSGFYVRSFCQDLGSAVGSLALMSELVRTRQGDYELGKNVLEYTDLDKGEDHWGPIVESMLEQWRQRQKKGEPSGDAKGEDETN